MTKGIVPIKNITETTLKRVASTEITIKKIEQQTRLKYFEAKNIIFDEAIEQLSLLKQNKEINLKRLKELKLINEILG